MGRSRSNLLPQIVAHRGGNPQDVENSRAAFRHGVQVGADLLECDLQLARDGRIVVYHNERIFGAPVSSFDTDELRALIPTLLTFQEMLDFLDEFAPDARLVLDLKDRRVDRSIVPVIVERNLTSRVLVTSKLSPGLRRLNHQLPQLRLGLSRGAMLTWAPRGHPRLLLATLTRPLFTLTAAIQRRWSGISTVAYQHDLLDPATVRRLHNLGFRVNAWTVDDPRRARQLIDAGVDYLTTNLPAEMVDALLSGCSGHRRDRDS